VNPHLPRVALSRDRLGSVLRKVVGWSVGPTIHRELVLDAVLKAVRTRRPRRTMMHSDQGTQYGSDAWSDVPHTLSSAGRK
jgi:transposase InsO family protein